MRDRLREISIWRVGGTVAAVALLAAGIAALALGLGADEEGGARTRVDLRELPRTAADSAQDVAAETTRTRALPRVVPEVERLADELPLEFKVAQLFLLGFPGQDAYDPIFERLRELGIGGIVLDEVNYSYADQLGALAGQAAAVAAEAGHVAPWVLAPQEGGENNAFADLPPASSAADTRSGAQSFEEAELAARTLAPLGVNGVLAPVADVAPPDALSVGSRAYSDDPREVATYVDAVVDAYRGTAVLSAASHFPGLGSATADTRLGVAQVPTSLDGLRRHDLIPFRAAIRAGVPAIVLSNALYVTDDFVTPGSLSQAIATALLRDELRFGGIAITDDLADPAVTALSSIPDAAVQAIQAGADVVQISGPPDAQQAAYEAVLAAVRDGRIDRVRLEAAVLRNLSTKYDYGLVE